MMPRIKLCLLGSPHIEVDESPVEIRRRKVKALLIYLAVTGQRHQRERLAALFWPDSAHQQAFGSLRRHLSELNKILGGQGLATDQETAGLDPAVDLWLDVAHFQQRLAECRTHDHAANEVCTTCLVPLTEAVALYRDDFLAGFNLSGCPDFDEWQFFQAEGLRQTLATALEQLVQAHRRQGNPAAAIPYARRRLNLDPLQEPAHRQLMVLYAETGQQAAALRQYQLCGHILADEFGIQPSPETTTLYEQIRSGTFRPNRPASPISLPAHNLAAQTTPFIGRETELSELVRLGNDADIRLLTILGPGGIGKTRLALEAANRLVGAYPHGVYFVPLAPLNAAERIVPAIAEAVKFRLQVDERSPKQQLLDYLSQKQLLLVLDNFEHLLDGAEPVNEILEAGPNLKIVVTSRERLMLTAETIFILGSMDFPTWETPDEALDYSAIKLFMQTAHRARPDFELQAGDLQYVARICRLVGGMPLGIILAAAWIEILTPEEIAAEITRSFDFLKTELRDIPERQRSIRGAFEHSWRRLSETERQVFMRCSIFRGGFTRQAAQTIAGASLEILTGLVHKSMVQYTLGGRYEIHELLRQYAKEKLDAAKQAPVICEAHASYYLGLLHQYETDLAGDRQLIRLAELDADLENIRAAWHRAVEVRDYALVDRALEGLYRWYWLRRDQQAEGRALLRLARQCWAPSADQDPHPVWGRILARVLEQEGPWLVHADRARKRIERALAIARQRSDQAEIAFCLWALGSAIRGEAGRHTNYDQAIVYYEQSLNQYHALNDRFYIAQVLHDLGHCYRWLWQVDKALSYLQQSLQLRRELGDKIGQGYCLRELGWTAYLAGNALEAGRYWQQAHTIRREVGERQGIADSLFTLSLLALTKGDWEQGQALAKDVLELANDIGSTLHKRMAARGLEVAASMAATKQPAPSPSPPALNTITVFEVTLFHLIFVRDSNDTNRYLQRALTIAGQDIDRIRCLPFAARFLAQAGEREWAVALLALAYRYPKFVAGWVEKLPKVRNLRADLEAALSPDQYTVAWERGQSLNLAETVEQLLARLKMNP